MDENHQRARPSNVSGTLVLEEQGACCNEGTCVPPSMYKHLLPKRRVKQLLICTVALVLRLLEAAKARCARFGHSFGLIWLS